MSHRWHFEIAKVNSSEVLYATEFIVSRYFFFFFFPAPMIAALFYQSQRVYVWRLAVPAFLR